MYQFSEHLTRSQNYHGPKTQVIPGQGSIYLYTSTSFDNRSDKQIERLTPGIIQYWTGWSLAGRLLYMVNDRGRVQVESWMFVDLEGWLILLIISSKLNYPVSLDSADWCLLGNDCTQVFYRKNTYASAWMKVIAVRTMYYSEELRSGKEKLL